MGWLYTHVEKGKTKEYLDKTMTCDNEHGKWEVLRSAIVSFRQYYAAVRITKKPSGESYVFGVVCLLNYAPTDYHNFGYKDMDESMGPNATNCPRTILELLSPLDQIYGAPGPDNKAYEYAQGWRERCQQNFSRPKFKAGDIIQFPRELKFSNGAALDTFRVVKQGRRTLYQSLSPYSGLYRITRRMLTEAKVVA